jgi:hypothetical protein
MPDGRIIDKRVSKLRLMFLRHKIAIALAVVGGDARDRECTATADDVAA